MCVAVCMLTRVAQIVAAAHRDSVSYTHLRAHETVLDLVCRLLLEKKLATGELPLRSFKVIAVAVIL